MKIEIKHRWTSEVKFTAEITCDENASYGFKLGLAVKSAIEAKADLSKVDLSWADLSEAKNTEIAIARTRIVPDGDIIGWKKCATGRKCRAEFAKVLEIIGAESAASQHDPSFIYKVGEIVKPSEPFSEEWNKECASGIHFFITRVEAEAY